MRRRFSVSTAKANDASDGMTNQFIVIFRIHWRNAISITKINSALHSVRLQSASILCVEVNRNTYATKEMHINCLFTRSVPTVVLYGLLCAMAVD